MDMFQQMMGFPGMAGNAFDGTGGGIRAPTSAYNEYYRAYSMAVLPGRERANVSYGGKIIMPPSALARLSQLDFENPWMFQLRNPANQAASTHAGVLEFIADEGNVHLPQWMMKTLRLNEGDPIQIVGARLPKGKFIKLQAQTVDFIEVSDPKAVLEQALRNFTCLTQGDIIEISYNTIVFRLLVMETKPDNAPGISVFETDLEVDFATPVGYKEPVRPPPPPQATMATKLGIKVEDTTPLSSRPTSSLGNIRDGVENSGSEAFAGRGETLNGRKTKGKGKAGRKITEIDPDSKIIRTDRKRFITSDMLEGGGDGPVPLNLPLGKLFFGYAVVPYEAPPKTNAAPSAEESTFQGGGNTLSGRRIASTAPSDPSTSTSTPPPNQDWGTGGNVLGNAAPKVKKKKKASKQDVIEID